MKEYITGIGGIFFRTVNKTATIDWYKKHFGLNSESWGKIFAFRDYQNPVISGSITWSPFDDETDYFGHSGQEFMINYRVRDLDELLKMLAEAGIPTVKKTETHDYGTFAWIDDCDERRIELWEPKDEAFGL